MSNIIRGIAGSYSGDTCCCVDSPCTTCPPTTTPEPCIVCTCDGDSQRVPYAVEVAGITYIWQGDAGNCYYYQCNCSAPCDPTQLAFDDSTNTWSFSTDGADEYTRIDCNPLGVYNKIFGSGPSTLTMTEVCDCCDTEPCDDIPDPCEIDGSSALCTTTAPPTTTPEPTYNFTFTITSLNAGAGVLFIYVTPVGAINSTIYTLYATPVSGTTISVPANSEVSWAIIPTHSTAPGNSAAFSLIEDMISAYSYDSVALDTPCWKGTSIVEVLPAMVANHTVEVTFDGDPGTIGGQGACNADPIPSPALAGCAWTRPYACVDDTWANLSARVVSYGQPVIEQGNMHGTWKIWFDGGGSYADGFRVTQGPSCGYPIPNSSSDSRWSGTSSTIKSKIGLFWAETFRNNKYFTCCSDCSPSNEFYLYVLPDPTKNMCSIGTTTDWGWYIQDPAQACGTIGYSVLYYELAGTTTFRTVWTYNNDPFKSGGCCSLPCANPGPF